MMLAWGIPGVLVGRRGAARARTRRRCRSASRSACSRRSPCAALRAAAAATRGAGDPPAWAAPAAGFASGALTTSTNTAGPPVVLYVLARGAPPVQTRDTLTVTFIGFAVIGVVGAGVQRARLACRTRDALAALVPAAVVGHLAGRPVFARIAEHRYEPVLTGVLIATALAGLATALL